MFSVVVDEISNNCNLLAYFLLRNLIKLFLHICQKFDLKKITEINYNLKELLFCSKIDQFHFSVCFYQ